MTRIHVLAYVVLLCASTGAAAQDRVWNFDVFLDSSHIGSHRFAVAGPESGRTAKIEARFNVKLLFINAYHYVHDAAENWRGNCLQKLASTTDDDGTKLSVDAAGDPEALKVKTSQGEQTLAGCVMSYAYWNPAILRQSRLLNGQTGEYDAVKTELVGEEKINVRGTPTAANHYKITGIPQPIDLWYSPAGDWLALTALVKGGRKLRYELK